MNVSLTPKLEELVQQKLASGHYSSASEVIREALRLLDERDHLRRARLEDLGREIAIGIEQADRGHTVPFNEDTVERISREGRKRLKGRRKRKR